MPESPGLARAIEGWKIVTYVLWKPKLYKSTNGDVMAYLQRISGQSRHCYKHCFYSKALIAVFNMLVWNGYLLKFGRDELGLWYTLIKYNHIFSI